MEADPTLMSYADLHGEWENREISIFGVVKSFISQLSIGQELTKVSMPSIFLMPYSILELAASRYLKYIHLLISAQHEADPVRRMSIIIQYFFSCVRDGNFTKKPYNALLGEVHKCFVNYPSIDGNSTSQARFIGQQVTHHPPLTAFNITTTEGISLDCNVQFSAKFHMNSVSVVTAGAISIKIPVIDANGQTNIENYIIDKGLPDALVKNVIFGTRSIYWTDAVDIMCKDTNTSATLHFDKNEYVKGEIYSYNEDDVPQHQASLKGYISDVVNIDYLESKSSEASSATKSSSKKSKKKKHHHKHHTSGPTDTILIDTKTLNPNQTLYPRQTDTISSLVVWKDVTKNIIAGDMAASDVVKKEIEDEQRKRLQKTKEEEKRERTYFKFNDQDELWEFKGPNPSN
ncbi:hypothetical protein CYY_000181 [Polysphondylium violaceum]|uniref:Oxysterol binding family protein n=1 Tax=Polysphondylium violaceum TaxID=133409 RepID=A0A8J4Q0A6_9MYCE|nr:hypothetical protein CYY_000181 [Polysphondylium violaceum]